MSNEELVVQIQNGSPERTEELWKRVERLIKWKANRIMTALELRGSACGVEFEDLVQCGYLAMVAAAESYSPEKGRYASWLMYHLQTEFAKATGYRTKHGQNEPLNDAFSLDKPMGEDTDGDLLGDLIPDWRAVAELEAVEEQEYQKQLQEAMDNALNCIPPECSDVIRMRYYQGMTQEETGKLLGISGEQARLREGKGLRKMRAPKVASILRPFYDFDFFYGTGLSAFKNTGMSVQERYLTMQDSRGGRP